MDGNGENVVFYKKSKERPRKLSAIHRQSSSNDNCEMGSGGSNGEDKLRPTTSISKRCKLPRKFFDDYNTVDHVSVPRKLRTAMKKRNHESISPPSSDKKQNHAIDGVELRRKDARKKCKKSKKKQDLDRSLSRTSEGPITKDEEEVVETLSALAVMFRFPINNKKNDFDRELVSANSLPLPERDSPGQYTFKERENSGSALWPGLFSAGSLGSVTRGLSVQSSTAKTPGGLHTAVSLTRSGSLDNGVLTDKDCIALIGRKKDWKRCSAQIYICRLIEALEIAERKDGLFFHPTRVTPNQVSKQGKVLLAANNLNAVQSCSNEANSSHSIISEKNPNEIRNAIFLHKWLVQDQQQGHTQKQCADFLSLSAGGGGLEATTNSTNKAGNVLEPWTQFHIPYLHSLTQNHAALPFSVPQIRFCSTPFADNPPSAAAAKQVQIPPLPHLGTPLPNFGFSSLPKQDQQERISTTQYRPMGVSATYFPNWHNGRHDPYGIHYPQFIFPPSHPSLEVLGPKYSPISQQQ